VFFRCVSRDRSPGARRAPNPSSKGRDAGSSFRATGNVGDRSALAALGPRSLPDSIGPRLVWFARDLAIRSPARLQPSRLIGRRRRPRLLKRRPDRGPPKRRTAGAAEALFWANLLQPRSRAAFDDRSRHRPPRPLGRLKHPSPDFTPIISSWICRRAARPSRRPWSVDLPPPAAPVRFARLRPAPSSDLAEAGQQRDHVVAGDREPGAPAQANGSGSASRGPSSRRGTAVLDPL